MVHARYFSIELARSGAKGGGPIPGCFGSLESVATQAVAETRKDGVTAFVERRVERSEIQRARALAGPVEE